MDGRRRHDAAAADEGAKPARKVETGENGVARRGGDPVRRHDDRRRADARLRPSCARPGPARPRRCRGSPPARGREGRRPASRPGSRRPSCRRSCPAPRRAASDARRRRRGRLGRAANGRRRAHGTHRPPCARSRTSGAPAASRRARGSSRRGFSVSSLSPGSCMNSQRTRSPTAGSSTRAGADRN